MIEREHVEKRLARLTELETELSQPETVANQKRYRSLLKEHAALKKLEEKSQRYFSLADELAEHRSLVHDTTADPELKELAASEIDALEASTTAAQKTLMAALLPPDPNDSRNIIMEIRAGTGGDEAALFAGNLYRMYQRFAEINAWKIGVVDAAPSEVGGYKEVVFSVEGSDVYPRLKYESGVHRVQRVPVTESQGRVHTSAATVAVFPEVEEDDALEIAPEELRIDTFCASGAGGQHVNKVASAVRITHLPTGIVAQSQDERSQHRNRDKAMAVLKARILDQKQREEEARMGSARRSQIGSGDRSERVRTYNFPQNRLTDHRINLTLYSLDRIMEGELDELTAALRDHDVELRLAAASDEA
jgi:peptide chain release factor 1